MEDGRTDGQTRNGQTHDHEAEILNGQTHDHEAEILNGQTHDHEAEILNGQTHDHEAEILKVFKNFKKPEVVSPQGPTYFVHSIFLLRKFLIEKCK